MNRKINYQIEKSREGIPTLFVTCDVGRQYLHSKINPLREAAPISIDSEKFDAIIILGLGLGYHLMPLKDNVSRFKIIIIIDILPDIHKHIAENQYTKFLAEENNIIFLTGRDTDEVEAELLQKIDLDNIKGISVIEHPASFRIFNEYYLQIKKITQAVINKKAGNKATLKAFSRLYFKNIIKNYKCLTGLYPVSCLFEALKDYHALVVTSGPSIEDYLKEIKETQNNFFIFAVDSAVSTLIKSGITPDFIVSIDPQPFIFEHIMSSDMQNSVLILSVSSHNSMLKSKTFKTLISLNTHPFSQLIDGMHPGVVGSVDSRTGTVAGDAIFAAVMFGFKNIGLAGFDFSFPDYKIYAREVAYQKRFRYAGNRFAPVESKNLNYIMKSSKAYKYEGRFTRKSFIQYKLSLESLLKKTEAAFYNINQKGLSINGVNKNDFFSTRFENIRKKEIIDKIFAGSKVIGDIINFKEIDKLMRNHQIVNELIKASLESDDKDIRKFLAGITGAHNGK